MNAGSCAPHRAADRNGPSTWMPAMRRRSDGSPRSRKAAIDRDAAASSSSGAVTRLSSVVVVPWARWNSTPPTISSGSPVVKLWPPPPCTWSRRTRGRSVQPLSPAAAAGAAPPPTSAMRPSVDLDPAADHPAGRDDPTGDRRHRRADLVGAIPRVDAATAAASSATSRPAAAPRLEGDADEAGVGAEPRRDEPRQLAPRQGGRHRRVQR